MSTTGESGLPPARRLYDRIKREQNKRGWTAAQLQDRSGVDRGTIVRWSKSTGVPTASKVVAIANALGIPEEELLTLAGLPAPPSSPVERAVEGVLEAQLPAFTASATAVVEGDAETEALLAKLSPKRRQMLEEIREAERRRLARYAERVTQETQEANKRFAALVRIQAEESEYSPGNGHES